MCARHSHDFLSISIVSYTILCVCVCVHVNVIIAAFALIFMRTEARLLMEHKCDEISSVRYDVELYIWIQYHSFLRHSFCLLRIGFSMERAFLFLQFVAMNMMRLFRWSIFI